MSDLLASDLLFGGCGGDGALAGGAAVAGRKRKRSPAKAGACASVKGCHVVPVAVCARLLGKHTGLRVTHSEGKRVGADERLAVALDKLLAQLVADGLAEKAASGADKESRLKSAHIQRILTNEAYYGDIANAGLLRGAAVPGLRLAVAEKAAKPKAAAKAKKARSSPKKKRSAGRK